MLFPVTLYVINVYWIIVGTRFMGNGVQQVKGLSLPNNSQPITLCMRLYQKNDFLSFFHISTTLLCIRAMEQTFLVRV